MKLILVKLYQGWLQPIVKWFRRRVYRARVGFRQWVYDQFFLKDGFAIVTITEGMAYVSAHFKSEEGAEKYIEDMKSVYHVTDPNLDVSMFKVHSRVPRFFSQP